MKYIREYNSNVYNYIKSIIDTKFNELKYDTEFLKEVYNIIDIWVYIKFKSDNSLLEDTEISMEGFDTSYDFADQIAGLETAVLESEMEIEIDIETTSPDYIQQDFKFKLIDKDKLTKMYNFYDKHSYIMKKANELFIKYKDDMEINYRSDGNELGITYTFTVNISEMTNMIKKLNK